MNEQAFQLAADYFSGTSLQLWYFSTSLMASYSDFLTCCHFHCKRVESPGKICHNNSEVVSSLVLTCPACDCL